MTDFDWTQINYFELSRWFPPRLRSKEGKKVRTKTFGYIDYFPNGTSKAPRLSGSVHKNRVREIFYYSGSLPSYMI